MSCATTLDEYLALPDDAYRYELQGGFLLSEQPPGFEHGDVCAEVGVRLRENARRARAGSVVAGVSFVLARDPETVRIPDVAFVRAERVATLADRSGPFPGAPDLAVEVLSPSNTPGEIHAKVADYLAAGTPLVWVVDWESRSVVTYRELLRPIRLSGDDQLDAGEVLPDFTVRVAELFERQ
jgi:Uma2 family endonuclease